MKGRVEGSNARGHLISEFEFFEDNADEEVDEHVEADGVKYYEEKQAWHSTRYATSVRTSYQDTRDSSTICYVVSAPVG